MGAGWTYRGPSRISRTAAGSGEQRAELGPPVAAGHVTSSMTKTRWCRSAPLARRGCERPARRRRWPSRLGAAPANQLTLGRGWSERVVVGVLVGAEPMRDSGPALAEGQHVEGHRRRVVAPLTARPVDVATFGRDVARLALVELRSAASASMADTVGQVCAESDLLDEARSNHAWGVRIWGAGRGHWRELRCCGVPPAPLCCSGGTR